MDCQYNTGSGGCCFVTACLAENLERNNIPFKTILKNYPLTRLMQSYHLLHEVDITKVDEIVMGSTCTK